MWHVLNTPKSTQVGILSPKENPALKQTYLAMDESKFVVLNKWMLQ
jgi:hypothetical protein